MGIKHVAASVAAAAATLIAAEASAQEITVPMTKFFIAIPLDARSPKEQMPNFGLQFQGSRPYQSVKVDYNTFKLVPAAVAGLEAKWIVAGAVAVGAAVVATHKDKSTSQQFQQQQQEQKLACPTQTC
jgi:hypothetical protein